MNIKINNRTIGYDTPTYIIAEIGINHNGSLKIAKDLIIKAKNAGFDAVKFQKRTPELCVPLEQRDLIRETPWGRMTYLEYKNKIEFGEYEYSEIDKFCKEIDITWFASVWDLESVKFIEKFNPACYKIASASITDLKLLKMISSMKRPIIMSTGMSTIDEIDKAVNILKDNDLLIAHSTSSYPCDFDELNLKMIQTLIKKYPNIPVGYSGHESGISTTIAAVVLGACHVERHVTLSRTMWGTDHSASLETKGMEILCRDIRNIEKSLGDGIKKVYDSEIPIIKKLRLLN